MLSIFLLACTSDDDSAAQEPADTLLQADGTDIVDGGGNAVVMRGVALGGWNFHENWITAVDYPAHARLQVIGQEAGLSEEVDAAIVEAGPDEDGDADWVAAVRIGLESRLGAETANGLLATLAQYPSLVDDSDLPLRRVLEARFGIEGRDTLLDAFQGGWITDADLAWIAEQGFNTVRVPMGYRGLTSMTDDGSPSELVWNELAFARIDHLLDVCEDVGLWAVLDIQEAPGGQNEYAGPSTLYTDPAMQALTVELWSELSRRYRDRTSVAAYSLLAEPMSAPDDDARDAMYDQLVGAIRANEDDHLLVIHDGFRGMQTLPAPAEYGWTNVVYSTHLFEWGATSTADYEALMTYYGTVFRTNQTTQQVPYYVGSFSTFKDEPWAYESAGLMKDGFEANGWSWTVWTFKRIDDPVEVALWGKQTGWGVRGRLVGELDRPDLYRDDEATLARKFAAYGELEVAPNEALLDAVAP
ncbi:hypothetical protein LBMAG42_33680 [Deltaproteobacteria bacterium]|nr:hypothetical protein LBMAG42_33680 [Deltaproteobacteria bacterium]